MFTDIDVLGAEKTCVSCGARPGAGRDLLYCSTQCQQLAKAVRYARAVRADGRAQDPDVAYAIEVKIAMAVGGGYSASSRQLTSETRAAVIERAGGKCQHCGGVGEEIDHIAGSESDLSNLQLLCAPCHREKTKAGFREATPEEEALWATAVARIESEAPLVPADADGWSDIWRAVAKLRRAANQ